jgi:two-component system, LytTR family, sensor kinase
MSSASSIPADRKKHSSHESDSSLLRVALGATPRFWRLQWVGWAVFAVGFTAFKWIAVQDLYLAVLSTLVQEPVAFLLTLGLRWHYRSLADRGRLSASRIAWRVVLACVAAMLIDVAWFAFARQLIVPQHEYLLPGLSGLAAVGIVRFLLYACWSFLYFWIKSAIATHAAQLAANAAQLQALRAQLNPHFLFNALNSIAAEAHDNPRAVKALAYELANHLRYSLAHRNDDYVALGTEADAMQHYLNVEKFRFEERFNFEIEISPQARAARVPGFCLQPLVENAVKHGLRCANGPLSVRIRATCIDNRVQIEVGNTGEWREPTIGTSDQGFGLESLRRRLQILYPGQHRFDIECGNRWVNVVLEIPLR